MVDERRAAARRRMLGVRVAYWRASGEQGDADAINIGRGGVFLRTGKPLPRGARIALRIQGVIEPAPWSALGRVVWTRETSESEARPAGMGLRFIDVDDALVVAIDRLLEAQEPAEPVERVTPRAAPVLDVRPGKKTMAGVGGPPNDLDWLAGFDEEWVEPIQRVEVDPPTPILAAAPFRAKTMFGVGGAQESSLSTSAREASAPIDVIARKPHAPAEQPVGSAAKAAQPAPPKKGGVGTSWWMVLSASLAVASLIAYLLLSGVIRPPAAVIRGLRVGTRNAPVASGDAAAAERAIAPANSIMAAPTGTSPSPSASAR